MDTVTSKHSDLSYAHEDELELLMDLFKCNGKCSLFVLYSAELECYFVSTAPITYDRVKSEFPNWREIHEHH